MRLQLTASLLALSMASILFSACSQESSPSGASTTSDPGQAVFLNNCMGCHMGPGDPPGPDDLINKSAKLSDEKTFHDYLRQPDNNMMPAIRAEQVSDSDVSLLYAYLKKAH